MATPIQPLVYIYTGDGSTTEFAFQCKVIYEEDIRVLIAGVVQFTGFTTTINEEDGGLVTFDEAPEVDVTILIYRYLDYDRITDYQQNGAFREIVVDNDQDTQTMQIQQLAEELSRTLKFEIGTNIGTCSIPEYTDEESCELNGGVWTGGIDATIPDPPSDDDSYFLVYINGEWDWMTIDEIITLILANLPDPEPQPITVNYYGWSDVDLVTPEGEASVIIQGIDSTAKIIVIQLQNINIDGTDGLALRVEEDDVILEGSYSVITEGIAVDNSISRQDSEYQAFGSLLAGSYACISKEPDSNPVRAIITLTRKPEDEESWDIEIQSSNNDGSDLSINWGSGVINCGAITGIQLLTSAGNIMTSPAPMVFSVRQYANTSELSFDVTTLIGGNVNAALMAEYGNMGTYFVNEGSQNDLTFVYNGTRSNYPPVLEGQSIWFLATAANTGNVTAQLGSQDRLSVLDEDGSELAPSTFTTNHCYRIYKRGTTFRYPLPETAMVADGSITLAKFAAGDPDTYLHFDAEGNPEYLAVSLGITTYEDSTGVSYTGAGQEVEWAHGLGDYPFQYFVELECTDDDLGYSVGRRIGIYSFAERGDVPKLGITVSADDTNIYAKVGNVKLRLTGSNGNSQQLTAGKWKFIAKAYLLT